MLKKGFNVFEDKKNGVYQIRNGFEEVIVAEFNDEIDKEIFKIIIDDQRSDTPGKIDELIGDLSTRYDKAKIYNVIDQLEEFNLLDEDNFYASYDRDLESQLCLWSLNAGNSEEPNANEMQQKIKNSKLLLIGTGVFLKLIEAKSKLSGFDTLDVIDLSSNISDEDLKESIIGSDFFIFDADEWYPHYLDLVNLTAVENNKPWIIFMGVHSLKASVGPLFIGKETGCYNCLIDRIKSHMDFIPYFSEYENYLKEHKTCGKRQGSPIVIYDMIASICVLEALKYITEWTIPILYKNFLTFDLFDLSTKLHPFLKAPVCNVCTPNVEFNSAPWLEPCTLKKISTINKTT